MRPEMTYVGDIRDACESILERTAGLTFDDFDEDSTIKDSVLYRPIVIGEATARLSDATRGWMPEIPWKEIQRMRNILTHDYASVDARIAWDVIQNHLPALLAATSRVLPEPD